MSKSGLIKQHMSSHQLRSSCQILAAHWTFKPCTLVIGTKNRALSAMIGLQFVRLYASCMARSSNAQTG